FALLLAATLCSCDSLFEEEPVDQPVALFDHLWETYRDEYAPFAERQVDWTAAYDEFRPLVSPSSTDDELFAAMSQLLAVLDDGHVSLTAPDRDIFFSNRIRNAQIDDALFDPDVIRDNYLEPDVQIGVEESYVSGKIKGENIGYIFFDHVGDNFSVLNDFLNT